MGSGKLIKRAINKYGMENFKKDILFIFDNEEEMNVKETDLVVISEETYNLCPGGKGGFGFINDNSFNNNGNPVTRSENLSKAMVLYYEKNSEARLVSGIKMKKAHQEGKIRYDTFTGMHHSEDTKRKIGLANSKNTGIKSSQFGTMWITDGLNNKKIKKDLDIIPEGWYKGRTNAA